MLVDQLHCSGKQITVSVIAGCSLWKVQPKGIVFVVRRHLEDNPLEQPPPLSDRVGALSVTISTPLNDAAQGSSDEAIQALMAPTPEDPQPLTEQEVEEREELLKSGFSNWNRRDFSAFTRACEKV